jgi:2-methylcitrate dehydratase
MQALVWAAIELKKQVPIEEICAVDVETYWSAWHESGSEPAKWDPRTRETADHSLPYILAWTLRHGEIDEQAFKPESYLDESIRPFMNRVKVRINEDFEKDFPKIVRMRVTATDKSGKIYQAYVVNPLGHEDNPISAADLGMKFMRLCEPRLGGARAASALKLWQKIEAVTDLGAAFDAIVV